MKMFRNFDHIDLRYLIVAFCPAISSSGMSSRVMTRPSVGGDPVAGNGNPIEAEVTSFIVIDHDDDRNMENDRSRNLEAQAEQSSSGNRSNLSPSPQLPIQHASMSNDPNQKRSVQSRELMKKRVLNQTLIIIGAFVVCWTPYVFITSWYVIDPSSASRMSSSFNSYLFMFAVSNSVVNPFVYSYNLK